MKNKIYKMRPISLALLLAGIGMAPASYAVDLRAVEGSWTSADGEVVPMWGFERGSSCPGPGAPVNWDVAPQLTDADLVAGGLTINLTNCLTEDVSIVIPGQPATSCNGGACAPSTMVDGQGRTRATSFTTEAVPGGTVSYTWDTVREGTYLYQSGSHPAKQVQMGLYGALTIGSYAGTSGDVTLLYSEIDPALHNPPTAATPLGYHPSYYLVNGSESQSGINAGDTNQPTVLRFLNAGLDYHVPTLNGSYMNLVAEDGNAYPYAKQQYSARVAAGKTIDALWQPATAGNHVIYDRRGNGLVASLTASQGVGAPMAAADNYAVDEDTGLVTIAGDATFPGVLDNDPGPGSLTAILVTAPSNGILDPTLAADGSFTYTPNADYNGPDSFTYKANNANSGLDSVVTSVNITVNPVNDAPIASDNAYDVVEGTTLSVAAPGVLDNDTDIDDASLTVNTTPVSGPSNGTLVLYVDGSFDYTPGVAGAGTDSFVYEVCDTEPLCDTATVAISIKSAINTAPVAVEDGATAIQNRGINNQVITFINLTDNDSDADGNLKDALGNVLANQITITTGSTTTRNGTVTVVNNGVDYLPRSWFLGTDTFKYTVTDLDGAVSNEVTVHVNVVRP